MVIVSESGMIYSLNNCSKRILQNVVRHNCLLKFSQTFANNTETAIVLGIETSCDDTACGIVDCGGKILGHSYHSQQELHAKYGGIVPVVAYELHKKYITELCESALESANLKLRDITAIAATVKPGLPLSLSVGRDFGIRLSEVGKKPFIPIHHMEAHALVARINLQVDFPYLVLLISGGHCILAIVENVSTFKLLGNSLDTAPGLVFDKIARRLKLKNILDLKEYNGGAAIEVAARRAENPSQFSFQIPLGHYLDCNFSFSGMKAAADYHILQCEKKLNIVGDQTIPDIFNFCASFQLAITRHLCQRTQRAMEFINQENLLPEKKRTLVVSGGVACNNFILKSLSTICSEMGYACIRPPPNLCTDNGLMIAWNGIERWRTNEGVVHNQDDIANVDIKQNSPLGTDWTHKVRDKHIKCTWLKIKSS